MSRNTTTVTRKDTVPAARHSVALDGLPLVYVIGDSHVSVFSGVDVICDEFPKVTQSIYPNVRVCRLGAPLAASMNRVGASERGREKAFAILDEIEDGSTIVLSFGEIDCRAHIPARADLDLGRIGPHIVSALANYVAFIDEYAEVAARRDIRVVVLSPPPTSPFDRYMERDLFAGFLVANRDNRFVRQGFRLIKGLVPKKRRLLYINCLSPLIPCGWEMRDAVLAAFNSALSQACAGRGVPYVDVYTPLREASVEPQQSIFFDEIHLSGAIMPRLVPLFAAAGILNFAT